MANYYPGFKSRTDAEQRDLHFQYNALPNKSAKVQFVKENSTRWSELVRLPYFDMCRMIVIDPMHNLFLGMSSTLSYTSVVLDHAIVRSGQDTCTFLQYLGPAAYSSSQDQGVASPSCHVSLHSSLVASPNYLS